MRWVATLVFLAAGCSPGAADGVLPLLDPLALAPVEAGRDPLFEHRPAHVDCALGTWGPEGGGFEVQTGACNYAAFDQALPLSVKANDKLEIIIWHDRLDAAEPATAHLAVLIGTTPVWETDVVIPGASDSLEAVVPIDFTPPADARLGLHLHNHGFNSWRFVSIGLKPQ